MAEYNQIDLSAWHQVGEGGNGKTYGNPEKPDLILKVNKARLCSLEVVRHEYEVSKAVSGLGLSVPKVHEIVRVGDAYGTLTQRIKGKKSLSSICHDLPERIEEMARVLSEKGKELFATQCDTTVFPSRKEQLMWAIDNATYLSKKNRPLIREFARTIPEATTCVHGDFQTGNLIVAEGKYYWIDLDRFAHGDPMFDIGHLFLICHIYSKMKQVQKIFHMDHAQLMRFWDAFAKDYTGLEDHSEFDRLAGKFACLDIVVRCRFGKPSFAESLFFRMHIHNLVKEFFLQ